MCGAFCWCYVAVMFVFSAFQLVYIVSSIRLVYLYFIGWLIFSRVNFSGLFYINLIS